MPKQPRQSKLYTRGGDAGKTSLFGGKRVPKDHPRVAAYGSIDELNAALGVATSFIRRKPLIVQLQSIQNELFNIGAELASEKPVRRGRTGTETFQLEPSRVNLLEQMIDEYDARVPALRTFVLPGGSVASAMLHLARTVCRRAERDVVTFARKEDVNPAILAYLNRLNDLLFVLARYLNKTARRRELLWSKNG